MTTLSPSTWIGNAAAVLCGLWGAVTKQAQQQNCSRQTVYEHAHKVQQALQQAQLPGPSREQLLEQNRKLRDDNRQLRQQLKEAQGLSEAKQQQFTTAAAALGLSLNQIRSLLDIFLPKPQLPSRAKLGRWVQEQAKRAGQLLAVLDQACRPLILSLCLDEIFFRRQPVLMGVCPHSLTWVLGQRTTDRSGATWAKALAAWPQVRDLAVDAGSGLEAGIDLTRQARKDQADGQPTEPVPLATRLDVFHTFQAGERALRLEWQSAEQLWEAAEQLERDKAKVAKRGQDTRTFTFPLVEAWNKAERAFHEADRKDQAWRRAKAALAVFRSDGRPNDRPFAAAEIAAATVELTGKPWAKACRMLFDERSLTFLDRMHQDLSRIEPDPERREALLALWRWRKSERSRSASSEKPAWQVARAELASWVGRQLGDNVENLLAAMDQVLRRVVRASSAVEGLNSVVRMHQSRHRNLSQELLDLKRLYWNCRSFVSGKRKGKSPYEHLGLNLSSYDPWELLQSNPEEWAQQVSSQKLAA